MSGELKLGPDVQYLSERVQDYSVPENLQDSFYNAVSWYLYGLEKSDIRLDQSGIRPKLQTDGGEYRDFIIREESERDFDGFVNLIGIESPGFTSCLEIADMVLDFYK
jgi:L-2-hydroxyglutarate oxidase LhgO